MGYARTVKAGAAAAAAVLVAAGLRLVGTAAATWLTPPYLYLVINAIIISIAASSRYQPSRASHAAVGAEEVAPVSAPALAMPVEVPAPGLAMSMELTAPAVAMATAAVSTATAVPVPEARVPEAAAVEEPPAVKMAPEVQGEEDFLISRSAGAEVGVENEVAPFTDLTNSRKKPLSSARFGRKAAKPSPEGTRALGVSRPRKGDTLENTWKAITEGRAPPLARHLKKADTFDTRPGRRPSGGGKEVAPPPAATMHKAETFNDAAAAAGGGRKVRREPSLGQDELNRRVEAFINKFNMEMRLQRQESLKHYNEMVSHY